MIWKPAEEREHHHELSRQNPSASPFLRLGERGLDSILVHKVVKGGKEKERTGIT
jgi:hypothetical protein